MNRISSIALSALMAVLIAGPLFYPAHADESPQAAPAASAHMQQMEQMQARMRTMQEQMNRLGQTTDPGKRQQLLDEHMQLMQEQMRALHAMGGAAMSGPAGGQRMGTGMGMQGHGMMSDDRASGDTDRPAQHQMMQDRLDMMQMMMEQMIGQMRMGSHG